MERRGEARNRRGGKRVRGMLKLKFWIMLKRKKLIMKLYQRNLPDVEFSSMKPVVHMWALASAKANAKVNDKSKVCV